MVKQKRKTKRKRTRTALPKKEEMVLVQAKVSKKNVEKLRASKIKIPELIRISIREAVQWV